MAIDIQPLLHQLWFNDGDVPETLADFAIRSYAEYEKSGRREHINIVVDFVREGIRLGRESGLLRLHWLNNPGVMLGSRYERAGEMTDLEEADLCLQAAWHCGTAIPSHRVQAAARCLRLLALQSKFDTAVQLDQEESLKKDSSCARSRKEINKKEKLKEIRN